MSHRYLFLFLLSLVLVVGSYVIFIQKPPLPPYVLRFVELTYSPFRKVLAPRLISLKVPILTYHYVEDVTDERDTLRRSIATRPYFFEEQLKYLRAEGYVSITLTELAEALESKDRLPDKSVILTFDDGYKDFYTTAWPLLRRYQIKAINYVIVNHIGRSGNLSETQIKEMVESGLVEIGCHTLDHEYLPRNGLNQARRQIFECKRELEERFGLKVNHFAYPGGFYNEAVVGLVKEAGFVTAVSTRPGVVHSLDSIYNLKRLRVGNLDQAAFGKNLQGPKAE